MAYSVIKQNLVSQAMSMDHAFPNIYSVRIDNILNTNKQNASISFGDILPASKISFEGNTGMIYEFNEGSQFHSMSNIERVKGINITFLETSNYKIITLIKSWIECFYDFKGRFFKPGAYTGTLIIEDELSNTSFTATDVLPKSISYPSYSWSDNSPILIDAYFVINGNLEVKTSYNTIVSSTLQSSNPQR